MNEKGDGVTRSFVSTSGPIVETNKQLPNERGLSYRRNENGDIGILDC